MSYRDYLTNEEALRRSPSRFKRADERTRTADLLITSEPIRVAGACLGFQISHIQGVLFSLPCPVLHRIALAVVSKWCQYDPRIYQRQSKAPVKTRPTGGSSPAAKAIGEPTGPGFWPCRSGVTSERISAVPFGIVVASASACNVRATISTSTVHESAATTVAVRESINPVKKSRRRP